MKGDRVERGVLEKRNGSGFLERPGGITKEEIYAAKEIELPEMGGMVICTGELPARDGGKMTVWLGYNDDCWVCTYFFGALQLVVKATGTIENGQFKLTDASNPFFRIIPELQEIYRASGGASNVSRDDGSVRLDGEEVKGTIYSTQREWILTSRMEEGAKNVLLIGCFENGAYKPYTADAGEITRK